MTEEEEQRIADYCNAMWKQWCKAGGLRSTQEVLGSFAGPREEAIFESGWKLGFNHSFELGQALAESHGLPDWLRQKLDEFK